MKLRMSGVLLAGALIAGSAQAADLNAGLVARFAMDGNGNDVGPNAFASVVTGTTAATDRNGKDNSCLRFDGVLDRISLPITPFSSMSVSVWINIPATAGNGNTVYPVVADLYSSTQGVAAMTIGHYIRPSLGINNSYIWVLNNVHTAQTNLTSAGTYGTDSWFHVVYTFDATTTLMTMYINGVLENSVASNTPMNAFDSLSIGSDLNSADLTHFAGLMDELVIYNRVLDPDEIAALNQGQTPSEVKEKKATICHLPPGSPTKQKTLSVGKSDVADHLAHGDYLGACLKLDPK
jgi:hypothetical protein